MTTPQATDGVPRSAQAAVHGHRLERVRGARRMVPADLAVERADQQAVGAQQTDQQILHRTLAVECSERRRGRCNRSRLVSRSVASWAYDAPAAAGRARTTSTAGPGSEEIRARVRCRRRRFTLLRVTALPTALLTTNPACGPACSTGGTASAGSMSRCRTTVRVPARRPRRVALENEFDEVSRWWRSSTGSARPRSDRELAATLATARGQDGAAGAGTHPQAKAMGLVPAAVVRLERALAHGFVSGVCDGVRGLGSKGVSAGTAHPRRALWSPRGGRPAIGAATWPSGEPWTRGTGRHRFDLPTVRGAANAGQTRRASAPLWTTA